MPNRNRLSLHIKLLYTFKIVKKWSNSLKAKWQKTILVFSCWNFRDFDHFNLVLLAYDLRAFPTIIRRSEVVTKSRMRKCKASGRETEMQNKVRNSSVRHTQNKN